MKASEEMKPRLEQMKGTTQDLKEASEADSESVIDDFSDLSDRYDGVTIKAKEKLEKLQKVKDVVKHLKENTETAQEVFYKIEARLEDEPQYETHESMMEKEIQKIEVIVFINEVI